MQINILHLCGTFAPLLYALLVSILCEKGEGMNADWGISQCIFGQTGFHDRSGLINCFGSNFSLHLIIQHFKAVVRSVMSASVCLYDIPTTPLIHYWAIRACLTSRHLFYAAVLFSNCPATLPSIRGCFCKSHPRRPHSSWYRPHLILSPASRTTCTAHCALHGTITFEHPSGAAALSSPSVCSKNDESHAIADGPFEQVQVWTELLHGSRLCRFYYWFCWPIHCQILPFASLILGNSLLRQLWVSSSCRKGSCQMIILSPLHFLFTLVFL